MIQSDKHFSYWQQKLASAPPTLALPLDHQRPPVSSFIRSSEAMVLEKELLSRISTTCEDRKVRPSTVLFAAVQTVLMRYTGQDDLILWFLGDRNDDANPLPPRLLPWRVVLEDQWSGDELIKVTASQIDEMAEHSSISDQKVSQLIGIDSKDDVPKINLVFVTSQSSRDEARDAEEILAESDIVFSVKEIGDEIQLSCDFDSELFREETISRMLGHVRTLLSGMLANLQTTISDLPMLTDRQYKELTTNSETAKAYPVRRCLHETFEIQAAETPGAVALTCDGSSLTYAELNQLANRLAEQLRENGVGPNVLVGMFLERSNELVVAILAILKAGGAYLPIDLSYPPERIAFMLEDSGAPVLITESSLESKLPQASAKVVNIDQVLVDAENSSVDNPVPVTSPDDLAYVIYTSGTTGKPKGARITHRNVGRLFSATEEWFQFNQRDVWTLFHSSAFDFSVWEIWGALLYGGRLVVVPFSVSRSPESYFQLLEREKVTVLNQTPSAFRQLIKIEESNGQHQLSLRYVIFGGEELEMESLRGWFQRHDDQRPQLVNMYGITETTVHVTYRPLSKRDVGSSSMIGVPIPDLRVYILEPNGQLAPIGVPGEMFVAGAGVCDGYLRRDELTAERFLDDRFSNDGGRLYRTGDQARRLSSGDIEYLGRIDQQVKIRGFRIELSEIETVLVEHPSVRESIVLAREDTPGEKRLTAYVVRNDHANLASVSELRRHLKLRLPDYMIPAAFVDMEALPLTNNGKVDRKSLPGPETARPDLDDNYLVPKTAAEKTLCDIWEKELRIERVGINDNYFDLGGDSLLLARIHKDMQKVLGRDFSLVTLFQYPTIRSLAQHLSGDGEEDDHVADVQSRAERQRNALNKMRNKVRRQGTL